MLKGTEWRPSTTMPGWRTTRSIRRTSCGTKKTNVKMASPRNAWESTCRQMYRSISRIGRGGHSSTSPGRARAATRHAQSVHYSAKRGRPLRQELRADEPRPPDDPVAHAPAAVSRSLHRAIRSSVDASARAQGLLGHGARASRNFRACTPRSTSCLHLARSWRNTPAEILTRLHLPPRFGRWPISPRKTNPKSWCARSK